MQYFRDFAEYLDELMKYGTAAYAECLNDMVKLMTEREVNAAILILVEARTLFRASMSLA